MRHVIVVGGWEIRRYHHFISFHLQLWSSNERKFREEGVTNTNDTTYRIYYWYIYIRYTNAIKYYILCRNIRACYITMYLVNTWAIFKQKMYVHNAEWRLVNYKQFLKWKAILCGRRDEHTSDTTKGFKSSPK